MDKSDIEMMMLKELLERDLPLKDKKEDLDKESRDEEDIPGKDLERDPLDTEAEKTQKDAEPEKRSVLRQFMGKSIVVASGKNNAGEHNSV